MSATLAMPTLDEVLERGRDLDASLTEVNPALDGLLNAAKEVRGAVDRPPPREDLSFEMIGMIGLLHSISARARMDVEQLVRWLDEIDEAVVVISCYAPVRAS